MLSSRTLHLLLCLALQVKSETETFKARIVTILVTRPNLPLNIDAVITAVQVAVKSVNQRYSNIEFDVVFRKSDSSCFESSTGVLAAEEKILRNASVFIGPGCNVGLDQVARMATYWNIPVFTAGGLDESFANKEVFKTLTRLSFSIGKMCQFILTVLKEFDWHSVSILVDETGMMSFEIAESLELLPKKERGRYELHFETFHFNSSGIKFDPQGVLKEANKRSRVFVVLCEGLVLRKILLAAYDLGMGLGDHVFLTTELIKNEQIRENLSWFLEGSRRNKEARIIFESLLVVAVRVPTSKSYHKFLKELLSTTEKDSGTTLNESSVNPMVAAFYDCVMLYGWALNVTLQEGGDPQDGTSLVRKVWNNTFKGELTGDIYINENGDREADFTLNDFDPGIKLMKPVAAYYGERRVYEKLDGVGIFWPGSGSQPPPDVPKCGFLNDSPSCIEKVIIPEGGLAAIVGCLLALGVACGVAIFFYRKMRLETQLSDHWWKVSYVDIVFPNRTVTNTVSSDVPSENDSDTDTSRPSTSFTKEIAALGINAATYKGCRVALKKFNIPNPKVSRSVLLELKHMGEITHENLIRFIGLSLDGPETTVLTELCSRGSLNDVLQNESMKIDWDFRSMMIGDIIEGMKFLHNSFISYHGCLKSSNCLIDGRFTVKITGYGLLSLREQVKDDEPINPRSLFWTSPEHLRTSYNFRNGLERIVTVPNGSQKGDVYSFGIILQEIVTRTGPYEVLAVGRPHLEPEEILSRVRACSSHPFRPKVPSEKVPREILDLMKLCWAEVPEQRPDFTELKPQIKKLTKGMSSKNVLDVLLNRMEQYANNLEALVDAKTHSLVEEKQRTDQLLYQLLPRSVAESLKKGCHVKPETFESVTVFFSDVVGFTPLAAQSSPIEVVDMLNDLYTCMDSLIENFDAYKVETIGDAYMVVSGLPVRNGDLHVREIAKMSLSLVKALDKFKIRHLTNRKLQLRIGFHSGSCATGVVGMKMPRYCVFGDTVNTASRMESTGEGMKIHASESSKKLLDNFGTFVLSLRGDVDIKGKGVMRTFWLEDEISP